MTPRTILACLIRTEGVEMLARAGSTLAQRFDAHLTGVRTIESIAVYPGIGMYVPPSTYEAVNTAQRETASAMEEVWRQATQGSSKAEWRLLEAQTDLAADLLVESARAADLVLVPQVEGDASFLLEQVIRQSGRPVLILPEGSEAEGLGRDVMVGWSGTPECTRALHDARPLLRPGARINLLAVGRPRRYGERDDAMTDMACALSRHGFDVEVGRREREGTTSETLSRAAFEQGSDMLVIGAYGHSRAYDLVLGAVTTELLRTARLPVLAAR
jgi:nucleotide-binding universal stress UspA family protein